MKDPAFLFYSKDWIEGTAEMLPEEKGIYIDLLVQQHQSGSLPNDTKRLARIARVSHDEFLQVWNNGLKDKFIEKDSRLINKRLEKEMTKRSSGAIIKRINGTLAGIFKKHKIDEKTKSKLKEIFVIEDFLQTSSEDLTICLTMWLTNTLSSLENENGNEIGNENKIKEGSVRETSVNETALLPKMFSVFKKAKPAYPFDQDKDFRALSSIVKFICKQIGISAQPHETDVGKRVLESWEIIVKFLSKDNFHGTQSLTSISYNIQTIVQKIQHEQSNPKAAKNGSAKVTNTDLHSSLAKFRNQGQPAGNTG